MRAPQHHISLVWPEPDEQHRPRPEDGLGLDFRYAEEVLEEAVRELASAPLAGLEARIKRLEELVLLDMEEPVSNPFARWLGDPSIEQYRGQHIALHPELGVIAHGHSLDIVIQQVRARSVPLDEIALDFIPTAPF